MGMRKVSACSWLYDNRRLHVTHSHITLTANICLRQRSFKLTWNSKITQLDHACWIHQDIRRFHVWWRKQPRRSHQLSLELYLMAQLENRCNGASSPLCMICSSSFKNFSPLTIEAVTRWSTGSGTGMTESLSSEPASMYSMLRGKTKVEKENTSGQATSLFVRGEFKLRFGTHQ